MGGAVSTGVDNNDLIDNLRDADYIRTAEVERAFRAVDRGDYILPEYENNAYRDQAWRCHHLHLSAPCIYSEVMEGLCLKPGLSFLNLGSGTGYLSTMVGLLLGQNGINHGVEYYDDVIAYANEKLEYFKKYSGALDEFDFCEPRYMQGNCLCLSNERQYDRVYVGAACPEPYDARLKSLLKIGGVLVMPFNEQLLQIKRTAESSWLACTLLPVSFATLIIPKDGTKDVLELFSIEPKSLQSICRAVVRNILRQNINMEMPELKERKYTSKVKQQKRKACGMDGSKQPKRGEENHNDGSDDDDDNEIIDFVLNSIVRRGNVHFSRRSNSEKVSSSDDTSDDADEEEDENHDGDVVVGEAQNNPDVSTNSREDVNGHADSSSNNKNSASGVSGEAHSNENSDDDSDSDSNHPRRRRRTHSFTYRMDLNNSSSSENICSEQNCTQLIRKTVDSPYTLQMRNKIKELPLPKILKDYLNFYRV